MSPIRQIQPKHALLMGKTLIKTLAFCYIASVIFTWGIALWRLDRYGKESAAARARAMREHPTARR